MRKTFWASRRAVVGGVATLALMPLANGEASIVDGRLAILGREFDNLSAKFDRSIEQDIILTDELGNRFGEVLDEIEATPATTIEGLSVKARVACWCLLGDLNTPENATGDVSMSISILRDLIRLYRPEMEKPGAIGKLIEEIERGAG